MTEVSHPLLSLRIGCGRLQSLQENAVNVWLLLEGMGKEDVTQAAVDRMNCWWRTRAADKVAVPYKGQMFVMQHYFGDGPIFSIVTDESGDLYLFGFLLLEDFTCLVVGAG